MIKNIFSEYLKSYDNKDLKNEEVNKLSKNYSDDYTSDWRWLSIKCERLIENELFKKSNKENETKEYKNLIKANENMTNFKSFFPKILLNLYSKCDNPSKFFSNLVIQNFNAVVFFCDASGFSNLAEQLDKRINGTELLGNCLNKFFNILIKIIDYWGGDIVKFSGDAVMVIWPINKSKNIKNKKNDIKKNPIHTNVIKEMNESKEKCYKKIEENKSCYNENVKKICLLALGCCIDIHKLLNKFPTPIENKFLKVHIAITYGEVSFLQIGNVLNKRDYLLSGKPLEEIGVGEALAKNGESVLSTSFYENVKEKIIVQETPKKNFYLFIKLKEDINMRELKEEYEDQEDNIIYDNFDILLKSFIPDIVYRKLSIGCNVFFNEIRKVTIIFVSVKDIDTSNMIGVHSAHSIMKLTQKAVFTMEGTINKFIFDDKGILILIMFGLPPLYHSDDSIRALLTCFRLIDALKSLKLNGSIGISTGRIWCGIVGNKIRKEYTALGDSVNVAARLCCKAGNKEIYVDENTYNNCKHFISFQKLISIKVKGKDKLIKIYSPIGTINKKLINFVYNNSSDSDYFTDEELLANNENTNHIESSTEKPPSMQNVDNKTKVQNVNKHDDYTLKQDYEEVTDFSFLKKNFLLIYYKDMFQEKIEHLFNKKDCLYYLRKYQNQNNFLFKKFHNKNESCESNFKEENTLKENSYDNDLFYNIIYNISPCSQMKSLHIDYNSYTGPLFLHEYYDPLFFDFNQIYHIGGVLFIEGNEHLGIFELMKLMAKNLNNFKIFNISNMPNSLYINITNPLLPWKILCNEILNMWKLCDMRKKNILYTKNDNFNILRELTHPSYHWFFKCMVNIIDDLIVPPINLKKKKTVEIRQKGEKVDTQIESYKDTNTYNDTDIVTVTKMKKECKKKKEKMETSNKVKKYKNKKNSHFCKNISIILRYLFYNSKKEIKNNEEKSKEKKIKKYDKINNNSLENIENRKPSNLDDNFEKKWKEEKNYSHKRNSTILNYNQKTITDSNFNCKNKENISSSTKKSNLNEEKKKVKKECGEISSSLQNNFNNYNNMNNNFKNKQKEYKIGIISSMVYYFSLHENTFIIFNYRAGTSLNTNVEKNTWKICKNIAKLAMFKRKKILKNLQNNLKNWRKNHCRKCDFCKGIFNINTENDNNSIYENTVNLKIDSDNFKGNHSSLKTHINDYDESNLSLRTQRYEIYENRLSFRTQKNEIYEDDLSLNTQKEILGNTVFLKKQSNEIFENNFSLKTENNKINEIAFLTKEDYNDLKNEKNITLLNKNDFNLENYKNGEIFEKKNSIKKSINDQNKSIFQMFREEKSINERKASKIFYKTLYPKINDNILLYIAEQKMKEESNIRKYKNIIDDECNNKSFQNAQTKKSLLCNPFFKHKHKPLIFLFVNGVKGNNIKELSKIKRYAEECDGYIKLENLNKDELYNFVSLCLNIHKKEIGSELIEYLHKICFGIPKFVQYTLYYLLNNNYIKMYKYLYNNNEEEKKKKKVNINKEEENNLVKSKLSNNISTLKPDKLNNYYDEMRNKIGNNLNNNDDNNNISYKYINKKSEQTILIQNEFMNFQNFKPINKSFTCKNFDEKYEILEDQEKKYKYEVQVVKDLNTAPLIPRLTAYCMSLIDSLNQEEQLLAKICSFFNEKFNIKKMEYIYPKYISRSELKKIIVNLVKKNVFCVYEEKRNKTNNLSKDNVNSIHNINFIYRDIYNKMSNFYEKKNKIHPIFNRHSKISDNEIFFYIKNFSLKKVLNDLLETEEKMYIKKIYKKYIED
ncbi:adenylyl cyclase beta, putative [Plasmodium relictum]|uniref:Adenylyl cyclase beta, putative n=1 Tax=Plasmodium relictum TaxID=85471 RepID=A0A1J1H1R0_PLARL|nr:adenylyl cyclase beta, putative [Plasmodium relictum]CRG98502.1 adenylyl cyclase beta, putative [Plasmodium relictum]